VVRYENGPCVDDTKFCNPVKLQLEDIEKLLNEIPDAPGVNQRQFDEFVGVPQVSFFSNNILAYAFFLFWVLWLFCCASFTK